MDSKKKKERKKMPNNLFEHTFYTKKLNKCISYVEVKELQWFSNQIQFYITSRQSVFLSPNLKA